MDVLQVGNKKYIKASVAAASLGYTSDYVGQLCRSGKVDAQLVGRSWYVLENSIQGHKTNRYRSTHTKTVASVREALKEKVQSSHQVRQQHAPHFYEHQLVRSSRAVYKTDEADLMPHVQKTGKLGINLADAEVVTVSSENDRFVFDTPSAPKIKFKGTLVVNEYDEKEARLPEGAILVHAKEVAELSIQKKPVNKVISAKPVLHKIASHEHHTVSTSLPMQHIATRNLDLKTKVAYIHDIPQPEAATSSPAFAFLKIFLYACACMIFFILVTFETHIDVVHSTASTTVVFDPSNTLKTISNFVLAYVNL